MYYGWDTTWAMTRKLQPSAMIFSDMGWDVRWVGNEKGEAGETSWATFTPIPEDGKTRVGPGDMKYDNSPTGTRDGKSWIPAECDVPLRPGWFYHPDQDDKVKSANQLFDLYLKSVGRGGCLDLGIAPDTRGLLNENDIKALADFGRLLTNTFHHDLAKEAKITVSNTRNSLKAEFSAEKLIDNDRFSFWTVEDGSDNPEIILEWDQDHEFDLLRIRENIKLGQRIGSFSVSVWDEGKWSKIAEATSIGNARILYFPLQKTRKLKISITNSPVVPLISEVGIFRKAILD
jgi:alpha-L-fucosidase